MLDWPTVTGVDTAKPGVFTNPEFAKQGLLDVYLNNMKKAVKETHKSGLTLIFLFLIYNHHQQLDLQSQLQNWFL